MIWMWVVLCAVADFVIAAVAVGAVVAKQSRKALPAMYDLNDAVDFVADRLPPEDAALLTYDDVRQVLLWHLEFLQREGIASYAADQPRAENLVVVSDDKPLGYLLGKVDDSEMDLTDEQIAAILDREREYYRRIGAFGPVVR
ncbi:MAG: hypothetical protein R2698_08135 [Microthrixaceae bacterium]